jgi:DNA-binding response OmpR family regulator
MNALPDSAGEKAASAPASTRTSPLHRILVVDDDISIRQFNAEVLLHSGYQVDAAADGAAAWEILKTDSYDLLITDHQMPTLTGVELLKKLRAARMALPAILITGTIPTEELNRHPRLQIEATLLKPFTPDELLGTVKKVLGSIDGPGEQNGTSTWQT